MTKKPSLTTSKEKRLNEAKREIESGFSGETKQTTVMLDAELFYKIKEVCIKRKRQGIEPNTLTGIINQAIRDVVNNQ